MNAAFHHARVLASGLVASPRALASGLGGASCLGAVTLGVTWSTTPFAGNPADRAVGVVILGLVGFGALLAAAGATGGGLDDARLVVRPRPLPGLPLGGRTRTLVETGFGIFLAGVGLALVGIVGGAAALVLDPESAAGGFAAWFRELPAALCLAAPILHVCVLARQVSAPSAWLRTLPLVIVAAVAQSVGVFRSPWGALLLGAATLGVQVALHDRLARWEPAWPAGGRRRIVRYREGLPPGRRLARDFARGLLVGVGRGGAAGLVAFGLFRLLFWSDATAVPAVVLATLVWLFLALAHPLGVDLDGVGHTGGWARAWAALPVSRAAVARAVCLHGAAVVLLGLGGTGVAWALAPTADAAAAARLAFAVVLVGGPGFFGVLAASALGVGRLTAPILAGVLAIVVLWSSLREVAGGIVVGGGAALLLVLVLAVIPVRSCWSRG